MSRMTNASRVLGPLLFPTLLFAVPAVALAQNAQVITGQAAFTDYSKEKPGTMRKITVADLPVPPVYSTETGCMGWCFSSQDRSSWARICGLPPDSAPPGGAL